MTSQSPFDVDHDVWQRLGIAWTIEPAMSHKLYDWMQLGCPMAWSESCKELHQTCIHPAGEDVRVFLQPGVWFHNWLAPVYRVVYLRKPHRRAAQIVSKMLS